MRGRNDSRVQTQLTAKLFEAKALQDICDGIKAVDLWGWMALIEIRRRYRRTVLGPFWNAVSMAILVSALGMVFATVWKMDIATYLPYLATGFMIWLPMSQIILEGGRLFIGAEPILKQVNLPFTAFACANVAHNMLVMAHYFIVWAVVVIAFQVNLSWSTLLFVPGVMLICINGVWISLIAGLACARYRDIQPLLASILQIVLFVTPIMWSSDQMGRKGAIFVDLNVIFHFIEIVRKPLLGGVPEILSYQIVFATTLIGWIVMVLVFSRCRRFLVLWL